MMLLGLQMTPAPSQNWTLKFSSPRGPGPWAASLFFLFIAAGFWMAEMRVLAALNAGLSGFLLLGALGNLLWAWDLELDLQAGGYLARRGLRPLRKTIRGELSNFEGLVVEPRPSHDFWRVFLVAQGIQRGYGILVAPELEARAAAEKWSAQLKLPIIKASPTRAERFSERMRNIGKRAGWENPPPLCGFKLIQEGPWRSISRWGWLTSQTIRFSDQGLELGVALLGSWHWDRFEWKDVSEVAVEARVGRWKDGRSYVRWRLVPHWREEFADWWKDHRRSRKIPLTPPPFWAIPLFFFDEFPLSTEKELKIRFWKKTAWTLSSSRPSGVEDLHWVRGLLAKHGPKDHR